LKNAQNQEGHGIFEDLEVEGDWVIGFTEQSSETWKLEKWDGVDYRGPY
jgi:hypothetical protein